MENWKHHFDDEGRSFIEFLKETEDQIITCVACSKKINNKDDLDVIEKIYKHTRSIEHGFKLYVMLNLNQIEVVDLTNSDQKYWSPKPKPEETNIEIARNEDCTLKISGFNPIKYVIPIIDLIFMKNKINEHETPRNTVLSSLDNFITKESSPTKRKRSANSLEQDPAVSSVSEVIVQIFCFCSFLI